MGEQVGAGSKEKNKWETCSYRNRPVSYTHLDVYKRQVPELMTMQERALLNNYHAQVYKNISPYLEEEEKEWLKEATREI